MPAAASTEGQAIGDLYGLFVAGGILVAGVVWIPTTWAILRYRRRSDTLPVQTRGNTALEAAWTVIPLITVLILFVITVRALGVVDTRDPGDVRIAVNGFQWGWEVQYLDTGRTLIGTPDHPLELVLPVDRLIEVRLSARDVVHAFYVPAFLFKRDAIPGRPSTFNLRITQAGLFPGQCAEYCGVFHDDMTFTIRAVAPADFAIWMANPGVSGSAAP
jgi:cytochrome c oxidase subunit 2